MAVKKKTKETKATPETVKGSGDFPAQTTLEMELAEVQSTIASTEVKSADQIAAERSKLEDEAKAKADALSVGNEESRRLVFEKLFSEATVKFDQEAQAALAMQALAARLESDLTQLKELRNYLEA